MNRLRLAVLGLYSSGSTAIAGALHRLGVCMGREFWLEYYEPRWLAEQLRLWWDEPKLIESVSRSERVRILRQWVEEMESDTTSPVGVKQPLLCLSGDELIEAWGEGTRFIWTFRPFENSVRSLEKRNWWPVVRPLQQRLWDAVHQFFESQPHLRMDYSEVMHHPERELIRLVEHLRLTPSTEQFDSALRFIQPTSFE